MFQVISKIFSYLQIKINEIVYIYFKGTFKDFLKTYSVFLHLYVLKCAYLNRNNILATSY